MLSDYHVHTNFSGDCSAPAEEQIRQALSLGMERICLTDHHDYDVSTELDFTLDFESYFKAAEALRDRYAGRIDVCVGVEAGLQEHLRDYLHGMAAGYPFDFIIGSTHFVHGLDPYYPDFFEGREEKASYLEYFETTLNNIQSLDDYDVAGHIDYVVRYGPNRNREYSYERFREILDEILREIIHRGKGIECNTAGYRKGLGQPNPADGVIARYRELGGEIITIGSDAHCPEDVGADFALAGELLQSCGFRYYTTYQGRKPSFHKL